MISSPELFGPVPPLPKWAESFTEHEQGIIRDIQVMSVETEYGFWHRAIALGALSLMGRLADSKSDAAPPVSRDELMEAVKNLIAVKGRHHTSIAYDRLVKAYDAALKGHPAAPQDGSKP